MSLYWKKQSPTEPLFPELEWSKPEQRSLAGKLAIIGGNKLGFAAVAESYGTAHTLGAGIVRAILPDTLKSTVPSSVTDAVFLPSNPSGGFSKKGEGEFRAACEWSDVCLLIGDTGKNSETAVLFENIAAHSGHIVITRDAADLLRPATKTLVSREQTTFVLSFAQLQKLFQAVYYPKILSFSMQLNMLVETLHKFTITYPCTIVTFHTNQMIVAHDGYVSTTPWDEPLLIWRGHVATKAACYLLWSPAKPFEAVTASLVSNQ